MKHTILWLHFLTLMCVTTVYINHSKHNIPGMWFSTVKRCCCLCCILLPLTSWLCCCCCILLPVCRNMHLSSCLPAAFCLHKRPVSTSPSASSSLLPASSHLVPGWKCRSCPCIMDGQSWSHILSGRADLKQSWHNTCQIDLCYMHCVWSLQ